MEVWELFIKGIAKTFEDFVFKMVERGRENSEQSTSSSPSSMPVSYDNGDDIETHKKPIKKRKIPRRELGELEGRILEAIAQFSTGCTLKEMAKALDMQWHYLRIPLRQLVMDKKVEKDGKIYKVTAAAKEETPIPVPREGIRRRVVDAKVLEEAKAKKTQPKADLPEMSTREKEILRFKILTAFRGRPEGLTLEELAAVLGRSLEGLDSIISELIEDNKVAEAKGGKYRLA